MKRTLFVIIAISVFAVGTLGEDLAFTILKAELTCKTGPTAGKLSLTFDQSFRAALLLADKAGDCSKHIGDKECAEYKKISELEDALSSVAHYRLQKLSDGSTVCLANPSIGTEFQNVVTFDVASSFELGSPYVIIARYVDVGTNAPFMIKITENSGCDGLSVNDKLEEPDKPKEKSQSLPKFDNILTKPKEKESPILNADLAFNGARRKAPVYSMKGDFRPAQRRRFGFGGYYDWTYGYLSTDVNINASEKEKKDVLEIGSELQWGRVFHDDGDDFKSIEESRSRFPGMLLTFSPKLETQWKFKEINLVPLNFRAALPINVYQSRSSTLRIQPFIGFESGVFLRSEVNKRGWGIARPLAGATLSWGILRKDDKPLFDVQIDYIQRVILKPELSYYVNDDGKEVPDRRSKRARGHVISTITFNKGVLSPFASYEYGRVPPQYILQNHIVKIGLKFSTDLWWPKVK